MKTVYITRNNLFKGIDIVLCNNITNVDESFIEDNMDIFQYPCEECKDKNEEEKEKCEECMGNGYHDSEPYQYFLLSLNDWQKERFVSYGVQIGYSEALELHVLPIYDFGTSWSAFSYSKEVPDDYELAHNETEKRETVY